MERKSFLDQEPPPGYIAGIGRGATGFVTQADLGSSKQLPIVSIPNKVNSTEDLEIFKDAENDNNVIISTNDKEDLEADKIYDGIEKYLEKKRGKKRKNDIDKKKDLEINGVVIKTEDAAKSIMSIADQFEDAKNDLASITTEQWKQLPESGDFTRRNKRLRNEIQEQQRFYRNSDMIALSLKDSGAIEFELDEANNEIISNSIKQQGNDKEHIGNDTEEKIDLLQLSRMKDKMLEYKIKSGNQKINSELDKVNYLDQLKPSSKYNIGDYKKTRRLFAKLRESNPYKAQNWIASALLEYDANQFSRSKQLIQIGCEKCPKSEEIWLTNLKINADDLEACKVIVADAIKFNYKSISLWIKAVELEKDNLSKIRILRKALELLPDEPKFWLEIIKYEEDKNISIKMLQKAVQIIPKTLDLWIALADLQDTGDAIDTLINSVHYLTEEQSSKIWIKIAKLEEDRSANEVRINKYIDKAFCLKLCDKNFWYQEAEKSEKDKHVLTCHSIILQTLSKENYSPEEMLSIAKRQGEKGNNEIASTVLVYLTSKYTDDFDAWLELFEMKRKLKDFESLFLYYEMALNSLPKESKLYIMYAKDKIRYDNDSEKVRSILSDALSQVPNNENLWIFSMDFEIKENKTLIVRHLFESSLKKLVNPCFEIWMKRINFEESLGNYKVTLDIVDEGLKKFPTNEFLYIKKGEIFTHLKEFESAKQSFVLGIELCQKNELLFIKLAEFYEKYFNNPIKSRSVLDQGISLHPKSDILHHSRLTLELKSDNRIHAQRLLSKALSLIPFSPLLWRDNIELATRQQVKNIYSMALKKTNDNPLIILAVARDLWKSGKIDKANQFFKACIEKDINYGDAYIYYYAFLLKFGSKEEMIKLEEQVLLHFELLHGTQWHELLRKNIKTEEHGIQLLRNAAVDFSKHI